MALRSHIDALNAALNGGAFGQIKLEEDTVSFGVKAESAKGTVSLVLQERSSYPRTGGLAFADGSDELVAAVESIGEAIGEKAALDHVLRLLSSKLPGKAAAALVAGLPAAAGGSAAPVAAADEDEEMREAPRGGQASRPAREQTASTEDGDDDEQSEGDDYDFAEPEDDAADDDEPAVTHAEKRKRAQEEHAFEEQESELASRYAGPGSAQATRVIAKEYMRFMRMQSRGESDGVTVSMPDEANGYRWAVAVTPPSDTPLFAELAAYATKYKEPAEIQMELLFSPAFPMEPPFVRVVRPRFAFHTGHVTIGGSICIELLTASGWCARPRARPASPQGQLTRLHACLAGRPRTPSSRFSCSSARSSSPARRGSTRRSRTRRTARPRHATRSGASPPSTGGRYNLGRCHSNAESVQAPSLISKATLVCETHEEALINMPRPWLVPTHLAGGAALFAWGAAGSSLVVLAEAAHQLLDATADAALLLAVCESLWTASDELPFGLARVSTLVRFGTATCVMAACLLLTIEIIHRSLEVDAPTPEVVHYAAAAAAPLLLCRCLGGAEPRAGPPYGEVAARIGTLLACGLALNAGPLLPEVPALSHADSIAAAVLGSVAVRRSCAQARRAARVLLQGAPAALLPTCDRLLLKARSLPGVADTRLESFWLLDEERAVGSLRLVLHAGADAEHAEADVRQLFGDVLHHLAVHLEESVGPPPCEGGAGVDAESLQARQRRST